MEPEGSLPCTQELTAGSCPGPYEFTAQNTLLPSNPF
jgi:hypothetical protein